MNSIELTSSNIIDALGGVTIVAKMVNIKPPSVHYWRAHGIPEDKLIRLAPAIEKLGLATRKELRPNDWQALWPELKRKRTPVTVE